MNLSTTPKVLTPPSRFTALDFQKLSLFRRVLLATLISIASIAFGVSLAMLHDRPLILVAILAMAAVLPLLWRNPVLGLYIVVAGAVTFESFQLHFPDSLTDRVPFFQSIDKLGGPSFVPFTPAEFLLLSTLMMTVLKRIGEQQKPFELGFLFPAVAGFTLMVVFGLVHGVGTGGNLPTALWEARAPLYLFFSYLLTFNLIKERDQARRIVWLFLIAVALKGILGTWRYLVTLGGDLTQVEAVSTSNSLLSHEESFFFALFLALIAGLFLFRGDRKQQKFAVFLALPVVVALLANQRRAGMLALLLSLLVIAAMVYLLVYHRRKLIVRVGVLALLFAPIYLMAFGNNSGILGQPARAIVSLYSPNERDLRSNTYREIENQNLKYNIQLDPVLGQGYGHAMVMFLPLPDLSATFSFWDTIPHNTVLWVWLRLGFLGFASFWFLIGRSIIGAAQTAKGSHDPYQQVLSVFAMAAIVTWVVQGALDQGIADFRATLFIGALLGLVARFGHLQISKNQLEKQQSTGALAVNTV